MAKQIKITFEKGGTFIADMLEDLAPVTCKVVWDALEKPWTEKFVHSNIEGFCASTPYFPVDEDLDLPLESLWCFPNNGAIAVISPREYREDSIKGYLPLYFCAWAKRPISTLEALTGRKLEIEGDTGESVMVQFKKNMFETCRANVFAMLSEDQLEDAGAVVRRIRHEGMEQFTIERV